MYVDITGFKVLILGGGYEATKKAKRFIKYGPLITVYSLEFTDELIQMANNKSINLIKGDVREIDRVEELIIQSDLIIYTVPNLNDIEKRIKDICVKHKKLHILSTNAALTQVAMPVETELHGLKFTVYSAGKSTLVAILALREIEKCLKPKKYLSTLLEAMYHLKTYMKERGVPYKTRMKMYRELIEDKELMRLALDGNVDEAIKYVRMRVDRLVE